MNLHSPSTLLAISATVAVVLATFGFGQGTASAATGTAAASSSAEAQYRQDRANCLAGKTNQDQKTCLKEAGAALQAAREHDLASGAAGQLAANARKRCEPLTGDDRKACFARAEGLGTTTGSVAGGGELHEMVTVVPGTAPETPAPSASGPTPVGQ